MAERTRPRDSERQDDAGSRLRWSGCGRRRSAAAVRQAGTDREHVGPVYLTHRLIGRKRGLVLLLASVAWSPPVPAPEGGRVMGRLRTGLSVVHAGRVGNEYFMTKGHFHAVIDTAETYSCDAEDLATVFTYPADAGHDYGAIERQGFRKRVVSADGGYRVIDNKTRPTMCFFGVTTALSSIMKVFPLWMKELGREEVVMEGVDFALHDDPRNYRRAVAQIKYHPLSLGALVTTHRSICWKRPATCSTTSTPMRWPAPRYPASPKMGRCWPAMPRTRSPPG